MHDCMTECILKEYSILNRKKIAGVMYRLEGTGWRCATDRESSAKPTVLARLRGSMQNPKLFPLCRKITLLMPYSALAAQTSPSYPTKHRHAYIFQELEAHVLEPSC